jgi:hypothetical protein
MIRRIMLLVPAALLVLALAARLCSPRPLLMRVPSKAGRIRRRARVSSPVSCLQRTLIRVIHNPTTLPRPNTSRLLIPRRAKEAVEGRSAAP